MQYVILLVTTLYWSLVGLNKTMVTSTRVWFHIAGEFKMICQSKVSNRNHYSIPRHINCQTCPCQRLCSSKNQQPSHAFLLYNIQVTNSHLVMTMHSFLCSSQDWHMQHVCIELLLSTLFTILASIHNFTNGFLQFMIPVKIMV